MTLKDLQEEGEKEFDEKYTDSVLKAYPEYAESHMILLSDIKSFLKLQTSLAYELGKKETIDMVLKEIEDELEIQKKVQEKSKEVVVVGRARVAGMVADKYTRNGKITALDSLKQKLLQVNPREEI